MRNISPDRLSLLRAVNAAGDAMGTFLGPPSDPYPENRALLWRSGTIVDLTEALGDPEWILAEGDAINDSGVIAEGNTRACRAPSF